MLVLSRKKKETIVVNEEITIEILEIKGNQVRIGITAPRAVRVRRGELTPRFRAEESPQLKSWVAPEIVREEILQFAVAELV